MIRQVIAIHTHAIYRGVPPCQQASAIRHADGVCNVEAIENGAVFADLVYVWGFEDRMAGATQVIRSLLISDDENEIWRFSRHEGLSV